MKVFIDYDSTLNDMSYSWVAWINKTYNRNYGNKDVTHWEWFKDLDINPFVWFEQQIAFTEILPLPKSQEFYAKIAEEFTTAILTSSHENMVVAKDAHILEHYGECEVIHHHEKWQYVTEDKICVLVDDRPLNCIKWVEAGGIAILFNHEANYKYAETDNTHENLLFACDYETVSIYLKLIKQRKEEDGSYVTT